MPAELRKLELILETRLCFMILFARGFFTHICYISKFSENPELL